MVLGIPFGPILVLSRPCAQIRLGPVRSPPNIVISMAKPRIFLSSTYYDLKNVRADLERYIRDRGFDPVLHERGSIPYGSKERPEDSCYREIEGCDILVSIIGGRYGSTSKTGPYSISQRELRTAVELGKQVYIFVESAVFSEFQTYKNNKDVEGIRYVAVDDPKIYEFLEEVGELPQNNAMAPFEVSGDITKFLQEQWAGLFQRLLHESARQRELRMMEDLKSTLGTLRQMVTLLTEERSKGDQAIKDIILSTHPIFHRIKALLDASFRVFFFNLSELNGLLDAVGFIPVNAAEWDDFDTMEWSRAREGGGVEVLRIRADAFDGNGNLRPFSVDQWNDANVWLDELAPVNGYSDFQPEPFPDDDDLPF